MLHAFNFKKEVMKPCFFILFFFGAFSFLNIYAQTDIVRDGFIIQVDPASKFITFEDTCSINYSNKSPRGLDDKPVSLYSIKVLFKRDRNGMEEEIFNKNQLDQIKRYRPFAIVYICSKTKKVVAISFVFRDMNESDIGMINTDKLSRYRDSLKNQIEVDEWFFEKDIAEHGFIKQSFRVFYGD